MQRYFICVSFKYKSIRTCNSPSLSTMNVMCQQNDTFFALIDLLTNFFLYNSQQKMQIEPI